MKSRLCQIMNWSYVSPDQVASGKRCWQDGTPAAGQQFEYTFDKIGNRKTAGRGEDHECIPNSGILFRIMPCSGHENGQKSIRAGL
jgi:hypothetical protein